MSYSVLIAEDDIDVREYLKEFCSVRGMKVDIACDGHEAINHLQKRLTDLIILDLNMPKVGGLDVLIATSCLDTRPKVILISGSGLLDESDLQASGLELTDVHILRKPFENQELEDLLVRLLK